MRLAALFALLACAASAGGLRKIRMDGAAKTQMTNLMRRRLGSYDALNSYFAQMTYGASPGPCDEGGCVAKSCNAPDSLLAEQVNGPFGGLGTRADYVVQGDCDWLPGNTTLADVQCEQFSVDDIYLELDASKGNQIEATLFVQGVQFNCAGDYESLDAGLGPLSPLYYNATDPTTGDGYIVRNPLLKARLPNGFTAITTNGGVDAEVKFRVFTENRLSADCQS